MAVGVYMPKPKSGGNGLALLGAGLGAMIPGASLAGAGLGMQVGGMLGSQASTGGVQPVESSAMSRRLESKSSDTLQALREGAMAVSDPKTDAGARSEYARPILTAYMAEAKKRGLQNPFEGFPEVG